VDIETDQAMAHRGEVGNLIRAWIERLRGVPRSGYDQHLYSVDNIVSDEGKRKKVAEWLRDKQPQMHERFDYHLGILDLALKRARELGLEAGLLEQPLNRSVVNEDYLEIDHEVTRRIRALAESRGAALVAPHPTPAIPSSGFYDLTHLVEPGRDVFEQALADSVVGLIGERAP